MKKPVDTSLNKYVRLAELRRKLQDQEYMDKAIDGAAEKLALEILPRVKK
jgi:hypothetical protein